MTPDRTQFHAAESAPYITALVKVTACEQHGRHVAIHHDYLRRERRGFLESPASNQKQDYEYCPEPGEAEELTVVQGTLFLSLQTTLYSCPG